MKKYVYLLLPKKKIKLMSCEDFIKALGINLTKNKEEPKKRRKRVNPHKKQ